MHLPRAQWFLLSFTLLGAICTQAEPFSGLSPQKSLEAIKLPPGFKATLFAGEPDIVQPVAFAFDDRGRLWVAENVTYPLRAPEGKGKDRILIFEDVNGDGEFDRRTVFTDNLNLVCGLELGFGGVWVGAAPYLLFIPIKPGEDKPAGPPEVLLDGFGYEDTHNTLSTFTWGPDGWLYGGHGVADHSSVGAPGMPEAQRHKFSGCVWRYHPLKRKFEIFGEGCTNPWGLDFNEYGQLFATGCVLPHLWHIAQGGRYQRLFGTPAFPNTYDAIKTIADHRHWAGTNSHAGREGYRNAQGQLETYPSDYEAGGGHAHSGGMIYLGGSWPEKYHGAMFMFNLHGHRVNSDSLLPSGSGYTASHGPDFLFMNDPWSLILNLQYGPDGSVFMIDFYEKNICHTKNPDFYDRSNGRIYKITYGQPATDKIDVTRLSDLELVALQLHPNDWFARHARRILQERFAKGPGGPSAEVRQVLKKTLNQNPDVTRKLRALWALHAINGLDEDLAMRLLKSKDEHLRGWTILLLTENNEPSNVMLQEFTELAAADRSSIVRLYLASAAQRLRLQDRQPILEHLLSHAEDMDDQNLPLMYWYALEPILAADPTAGAALLSRCSIPLLRQFIARRIAQTPSTHRQH
ncbi:MAG TPA: PVC-type heme-binding CxxCH protein [Verrucomicrobiae bacterium]